MASVDGEGAAPIQADPTWADRAAPNSHWIFGAMPLQCAATMLIARDRESDRLQYRTRGAPDRLAPAKNVPGQRASAIRSLVR